MSISIFHLCLFLASVFLSSVSQVLLKKAAMRPHKNVFEEYTDWRVILGYGMFVCCTLMTMIAYQKIPLNLGTVLESTGYLYVTFFGVVIFKEKMSKKKILALCIILSGILIYAF